MMVVPPSIARSEGTAAPAAMILEARHITNRDVLIEPGNRLSDCEGSRAFVLYLKGYSFGIVRLHSTKEAVQIIALVMKIWYKYERGRFLERLSHGSNDGSEWVVLSKINAVKAAVRCFAALSKAALKMGPSLLLLADPSDESVLEEFWKHNNAVLAAADK
jgi:hypothetical protein